MLDYFKRIVIGQFEAALAMMNDCFDKCPPEHWDGIIGKYPFWHVAYHTLCFVDLYLSPGKQSFQPRRFHPKGWSEFDDEYPSRRFEKEELRDYLILCRQKVTESIAGETEQSLEAKSGFDWLKISRGELHLYNIRHAQHHIGQLSAFLRRIDPALQDPKAVRWVATGWR